MADRSASKLYPSAAGPKGLREQKKSDKRERIRKAAQALFAEAGYDAATLRQIADRAEVGLGTLFDYVSTKRDLVFLICNEDLDATCKEALSAALLKENFYDQVVAVFHVHYVYFARDVELSRILLRELLFYSEGEHAAFYLGIRTRLLKGLERLVRMAKRTGDIGCTEDPELIARHIFFAASAAIRWWIATANPDHATGVREFSRLMAMQMHGLAGHPKAADRPVSRRTPKSQPK
jgi:AcrR family transcriptional regulator